MKLPRFLSVLVLFATIAAPVCVRAADEPVTRTEDVIYGRKHGTALTLDVFQPTDKSKRNGAGVVFCVSGGWFSSHAGINVRFFQTFLNRGYTVFAVVHGSQPKFTIPEVISDMHRAVRFIRHSAKEYGVDPNRLGIAGGSAGGHLSLMMGTAGTAGKPKSKDPVERQSSRVQAVACFFPPTDFLNYGKTGENALGRGVLKNFRAPFDFKKFDPSVRAFKLITDESRRNEIGKEISPVYHVTKDDPPTLIIHGDADKLVPIQQAELIIEKLKTVKVPAKLIVKKGAAHGWAKLTDDVAHLADWFDTHLKPSGDKSSNKSASYRANEAVAKKMIAILDAYADVLETVKDKETAKAAAEKLDDATDRFAELLRSKDQLPKVSKAEDARLEKQFLPQLKSRTQRLQKAAFSAGTKCQAEEMFMAALKRMQKIGTKASSGAKTPSPKP